MYEGKYNILMIKGYLKNLNFEKTPTLPAQIIGILVTSKLVTLELIKKQLEAPEQTIKNIPIFLNKLISIGIIINSKDIFYLNPAKYKELFELFPETRDIIFRNSMNLITYETKSCFEDSSIFCDA